MSRVERQKARSEARRSGGYRDHILEVAAAQCGLDVVYDVRDDVIAASDRQAPAYIVWPTQLGGPVANGAAA